MLIKLEWGVVKKCMMQKFMALHDEIKKRKQYTYVAITWTVNVWDTYVAITWTVNDWDTYVAITWTVND